MREQLHDEITGAYTIPTTDTGTIAMTEELQACTKLSHSINRHTCHMDTILPKFQLHWLRAIIV